ncbi:MAG TPA: rhodanese-like domain-containing protein, partial [Candidatus Limnocylindrales bacterium]|nr:rhodanese-like domain-containing protein [Candidatus Limnocylindrales bacterium]
DETFDVGALRFRSVATPGHTPEHTSYSVADRGRADDPLLLFTGGSLLVGAVGRTDLLGTEHEEPYARQMHASLHDRLLAHEDYVTVLPTHGGGSLCSKSIASTPWSTVGFERRHQPLLAIEEVETFVRALLADQPAYPRYFARMRPMNQAGPPALGTIPGSTPLPADRVSELLDADAMLIDLRSPQAFADGHVPGSLSIPAGSSFGTWLGWIAPHDRPLILLLRSVDDWDGAIRQALRIGYDDVLGMLEGGFEAWRSNGGPIEAGTAIGIEDLRAQLSAEPDLLLIDVRQASEYADGHVPGSRHLNAGDLPERLAELPRDRPIATICASGYRSAVAAGLLRQAGFRDVRAVRGGVPEWGAAGYPVEMGGAK